jgi:TRAP-type C4-dicarboxylate transport system substrate-binding protein
MNKQKMIKRFFLATLCLGLFTLPLNALAAEINLKLGVVTPPKTDTTYAAKTFSEKVAINTNGKVNIKVYDSAQFGNQAEHWAQVRSGAIDLFVSAISTYFNAEPPPKNFLVLSTPFLFDDAKHYQKFVQSDVFKYMVTRIEKAAGLKHVGYAGDRPPRCFSTVKVEAQTPADIKGLKLRTPGFPVVVAAYKAWGASPTPLAAAEIYNALKTGLVDGVDLSLVNAYRIAGEVIKYSMNIEYLRDGFAVKMNGKKWDSMAEELKAAFEKSAEETATLVTKFSNEELAKNKERLKANGVKVVEIKDKSPWKAVVPEIVGKFDGNLWEKGLYQKIRDLNK